MHFPQLRIEKPFTAKETEFREAVTTSLGHLEAVVYVLPVISFGIPLLKARLLFQAVVTRCVVTRLATTPIRFQARTKFYLPLLLAQFHHVMDDLKAGRTSQFGDFEHALCKTSSRWHHETAAGEYLPMITLRVPRFVLLSLLPLPKFPLHQLGLLPAQLGFFLALLLDIHIRFQLQISHLFFEIEPVLAILDFILFGCWKAVP